MQEWIDSVILWFYDLWHGTRGQDIQMHARAPPSDSPS